MKEHTMREKVKNSTSEVFEKMFYLYIEENEETVQPFVIASSIRFAGPWAGSVTMQFTDDLIQAMVRNMLGIEDGAVGQQERADCAREAVNMVCGNFLANLEGTDHFDLGIPQIVPQPDERSALTATERLFFKTDGGCLRVILAYPVDLWEDFAS
ncbi:MAG: chemotaxis protein CheX [Deltaproteobacteria bacterium]|nr:chemotaxis protein CheX [Deltaproteobacteria bacterium]